jgi:hypothetical protein
MLAELTATFLTKCGSLSVKMTLETIMFGYAGKS